MGDPIPAGLVIKADMEFLSIAFSLDATVDTDGFDLNVQVNDMSVSRTTRLSYRDRTCCAPLCSVCRTLLCQQPSA